MLFVGGRSTDCSTVGAATPLRLLSAQQLVISRLDNPVPPIFEQVFLPLEHSRRSLLGQVLGQGFARSGRSEQGPTPLAPLCRRRLPMAVEAGLLPLENTVPPCFKRLQYHRKIISDRCFHRCLARGFYRSRWYIGAVCCRHGN